MCTWTMVRDSTWALFYLPSKTHARLLWLSVLPCVVVARPPARFPTMARLLLALLVAVLLALSPQGCAAAKRRRGEGGGRQGDQGRAPPDLRALDLAIDDARLDDEQKVVDRLIAIKNKHIKEMGEFMRKSTAVETMREIDRLSGELAGSTGAEREALHSKLHDAIGSLEDEKFVSMGMTEEDREAHRALLRLKHAVVMQLVDDEELAELSEEEHVKLMERYENIEIKIVSHMKDYFMAKARKEL
jgi:hypothetical protein